MKRIALLLAFALLAGVLLAACGSGDTSSAETGSEAGAESGTESGTKEDSEASSAESKETSGEEGFADSREYASVVSLGCSYKTEPEAASQYADSYHSELTDGLFADSPTYGDAAYAGYEPSGVEIVTLDLGKVCEKLYRFRVSYLHTSEAGITPPSSCKVSFSADGEKWEDAGDAVRKGAAEANSAQMLYCDLDHYVSARYVRFVLTKAGHWLFFDEFSAIADVEGEDPSAAYVAGLIERYGADAVSYEERARLLASVKGTTPDLSATRIEIGAGKKYTLSASAASGFEDDGTKLTDGVVTGYLESGAWIGFHTQGKDVTVTVDLGKERDDILEFAVSAYANGSTSCFPSDVSFAVSDDKKTFVELGRCYGPGKGDQRAYTFLLTLKNAVKGRYVRFTFHSMEDDALIQIEECGVYSYGEPIADEELYPAVKFPKVTDDSFWSASEKDYAKEINLLEKLPVQAEASSPEASAKEYNTPVSSGVLTDGKTATGSDIHNGQYFKFNSCGSRNLFFDLGHLSQIDSMWASFLNYTDWGVYLPQTVSVALSDNAVDWYIVGAFDFGGGKDCCTTASVLEFKKPYVARFVRFSFDVSVWMASDELRVLGTKKVDGKGVRLAGSGLTKETVERGSYLKPRDDLLGGAKDICLMYHGKTLNHSEADLLPYVAYLDRDGNIKDTMFDGYLFLLSGSFPSGAMGHEGSVKTDWDWTLNQLFAQGKNLDALNKTVGKVNDALGLSGRKVSIFVTLYYLRPEMKSFGDVDGDGVSEDLSVLENRFKVIRWFTDTFEKRLAEAGYENLKFDGYYWYHESIPGSSEDADSRAYITGTAKLVHERGQQLFWIPYYNSHGYTDWAQFGLDAACLQPNYAFHADVIEKRLTSAANTAKSLGMCIELEIDDQALNNMVFFRKYMDYMKHGVTDGYMAETIHMYYQSGSIFRQAYASANARVRLIYEYTYQFIRHTLDGAPDALPEVSATVGKDTATNGKLADAGNEYAVYRLTKSPEHGTVSVNEDGSFTYYPDKGYTGEDSFGYVYSAFLGDSGECVCSVSVE